MSAPTGFSQVLEMLITAMCKLGVTGPSSSTRNDKMEGNMLPIFQKDVQINNYSCHYGYNCYYIIMTNSVSLKIATFLLFWP